MSVVLLRHNSEVSDTALHSKKKGAKKKTKKSKDKDNLLMGFVVARAGTRPSLRTTIDGAYQHTLLPYHGWMTQKAFEVAAAAAPAWSEVRPVFAPSDEAFRDDVGVFVQASQRLLQRINAALARLDLVDTRKSV